MAEGTRQNIAQLTVENSSQVILLLTTAEIIGIEEIIQKYTKKEYCYTLTFSAHYPHWIKNQISTKTETKMCDHTIFERKEVDNFSQKRLKKNH